MKLMTAAIAQLLFTFSFAQQFYADIHKNNLPDGNGYLVTFAAYPPNESSQAGHMFVIWEKESGQGRKMIGAFGFYGEPSQNSFLQSTRLDTKAVIWGLEPGAVHPEDNSDIKNATARATFRIDKEQFEKTLEIKNKWSSQPPNYSLLFTNCVKFGIDIGESIGIKMPIRTPITSTPNAYMVDFINELKKGNIVSNDANNWQILVNPDGMYYFGVFEKGDDGKSKFTGRQRTIDTNDGSILEGFFYRDVEHGPMMITYPTGNHYYYDNSVKPARSEMIFANGTTIYNYKPNTAEQDGYVASPNGDIYYGPSENGVYNGDGQLWEKSGFYRNAYFKNGVFIRYNPISYINGTYYGALLNGLPSGPGKMISPNGFVYTGSYFNGLASGAGKIVFPDKQTYVDAQFSNGIMTSGRYVLPNGVYYQGPFVNGMIPGNAVFYNSDGSVIGGQSANSNTEKGAQNHLEKAGSAAGERDFKVMSHSIDFDLGNEKVTFTDRNGNVIESQEKFKGGGLTIEARQK
jgi:hypothetical protein